MSDVTTWIEAARRGDNAAVAQLCAVLYDELRVIARAKLAGHDRPTLLDTTGLVHDAFVRLVQLGQLEVSSRPHFLAYAARVMHSIVVDAARRRLAERRGGQAEHVPLDDTPEIAAPGSDDELIRVHDALGELATIDERMAQIVEMRYFAGLGEAEIADALGVSTRTVEREWQKARLFLFDTLR